MIIYWYPSRKTVKTVQYILLLMSEEESLFPQRVEENNWIYKHLMYWLGSEKEISDGATYENYL